MITRIIRTVPSDMASSLAAARCDDRPHRQTRKAYRAAGFHDGTRPRAMLFRLQLQRCRVDAVAQPGRPGAVGEDMAEMAAAFGAEHRGADHAVADVALLVDMALDRGLGEARPAAAGIELGVGFEQHIAAAGAD